MRTYSAVHHLFEVATKALSFIVCSLTISCFLSTSASCQMTPGYVYTFAGLLSGHQDGYRTQAEFGYPADMVLDKFGNFYVADWSGTYTIRKIDAAGNVTTYAGSTALRAIIDGEMATNAPVYQVYQMAVDSSGNLFLICSNDGSKVYEITTDGIIHWYAGGSDSTNYGDGGDPKQAYLESAIGLAFDSSNRLYINTPLGIRLVSGGVISTFGPAPLPAIYASWGGMVVDALGNVFVSETCEIDEISTAGSVSLIAGDRTTCGYRGEGSPATQSLIEDPSSLIFDSAGNLFFGDRQNHRIREINMKTGIIATVVGTGSMGAYGTVFNTPSLSASFDDSDGVVFDPNGNMFIAAGYDTPEILEVYQLSPPPKLAFTPGIINTIAGTGTYGYNGDNILGTSAEIAGVGGIAVDAQSNLIFSDYGNNRVRVVNGVTDVVSTIAGTGASDWGGDAGPAMNAYVAVPRDVAVDSSGNVYINDAYETYGNYGASSGLIWFGNQIRAVYNGGAIVGLSSLTQGDIYAVVGNSDSTVPPNTCQPFTANVAALSTSLCDPRGVKVDSFGNIYINGQEQVYEVYNGGVLPGVSSPVQGYIYLIAGSGPYGYSGDGGPAINAALNLNGGSGNLAVDSSGNVFMADEYDAVVRVLYRSGSVAGLTNLTPGYIYTVAGNGTSGLNGDGGLATASQLQVPSGIAVDNAGSLYIADGVRLRKVDSTGVITTVVNGGAVSGFSGDGGVSTAAETSGIAAVAVDSYDNLFLTDDGRIRKVTVNQSAIPYSTTQVGQPDTVDGPQTVTVTNFGAGTLIFWPPTSGTNPSIGPDFTYDYASTCPLMNPGDPVFTLAAGASCTYVVDFAPMNTGTLTESLVLSTNDPMNPAATISLTGSGTSEPPISTCHNTPHGVLCTE